MTKATWGELVEYLYQHDIPYRCEADLTYCLQFCQEKGLDEKEFKEALLNHGGACDCEALCIGQGFPKDHEIIIEKIKNNPEAQHVAE